MLQIPYKQLSDQALLGLIEEFITREGTDYGFEEVSLETKVAQVQRLLKSGEVVIVFDEATESCNIMPKEIGF